MNTTAPPCLAEEIAYRLIRAAQSCDPRRALDKLDQAEAIYQTLNNKEGLAQVRLLTASLKLKIEQDEETSRR